MNMVLIPFQKPMMAPLGEVIPESFGFIACCGKGDAMGIAVCCAH